MNNNEKQALLDYTHSLEKAIASGNATEHTYRPALKILLESLAEKITATDCELEEKR